MPTLVVHERHGRCPQHAGARASQQYDTGWYTADAHTGGARATQPMPTTCWCTSKPAVRYRLVYSRRPHWWCTSGAADAHSGGARATQPMPTICWCTSKPSTIQVGIQPMPTLVVHERHSRCPHWWCTSDTADAHHMLVHEQANVTQPYGLVYTRLTLACLRSHFDEVLNPDMFILQAHAWPVRAGRSQCPLGVVKCHSNRSWR